MTTTVEVVYESGMLRLLTPVSPEEGKRLSATLTDSPVSERTDAAYLLTLPRAERELTAFMNLDGQPFRPHKL